ncbi:hypothetical protein PTKIN_Ptkin17bG0033200 [Pterospermum kingtungense]
MTFGAISWLIWLLRNDIASRGKRCDLQMVFDLIKIRLANWIKAKWSELNLGILDIFRQPYLADPPRKCPIIRPTAEWSKPLIGSVKFNVDGSSRGNPGQLVLVEF